MVAGRTPERIRSQPRIASIRRRRACGWGVSGIGRSSHTFGAANPHGFLGGLREEALVSEIHVRGARPDDAAEVAALLVELGYPDNGEAAVRRRLAIWEKEASGAVLVAERDGRVVGTIAVTAIPYLEREGRWGRLVALVT